MWGNFGNLMNPLSGNLNLFVTDNTGLKVAQVPPKEYADRSKVYNPCFLITLVTFLFLAS